MRILAVLAFVGVVCAAQAQTTSSFIPAAYATPPTAFYLSDFGAKCDGVTNDNSAINAALSAAAASNAYQNNNAISIVGVANGSQRGCVINSLNFTQFNKANGANTRAQVFFSDVTLLCSGAKNICLDALGATFLKFENVSVRGDNVATPEICLQVGGTSNTSAAWHSTNQFSCNGDFSLAALYNVGSESNLYSDSFFVNAHTANGPIGTLGTVTGGSGCANSTFPNVALTGGSGTGALATIVTSGGAVSSVTVTYEGRDYAPSDVLSAVVSTCSGFSVPVSTVTPYAVILDGQNHWRSASAFATQTLPTDAWISLTLVTFLNSHARMLGNSKAAIWSAWAGGLHMIHSYAVNSGGPSCILLFNNGVTKAGIPGPNWGLDLDFNCEGSAISSAFLISGSLAAQTFQDLRYRGYHLAQTAMFALDAGVTSVILNNADIDLKFATANVPMFASPSAWTVAGNVSTSSAGNWSAPALYSGMLTVAGVLTQYFNNAVVQGGAGTPAGVVSCITRCLYIRTDGAAGSTLYVNETGGGTSGWAAK